jgi:hypothetical protein
LAKFFYPSEYWGFEVGLESSLEIVAFSGLLAAMLYPIYTYFFKRNVFRVSI